MKVLVPHGDEHMQFGIIQLEDGSLRSSTPCCGFVMFPGNDKTDGTCEALCVGCGKSWEDLCRQRSTGAFFEGWFGGYPKGYEGKTYSTLDEVIISWIQRTLDDMDAKVTWTSA